MKCSKTALTHQKKYSKSGYEAIIESVGFKTPNEENIKKIVRNKQVLAKLKLEMQNFVYGCLRSIRYNSGRNDEMPLVREFF